MVDGDDWCSGSCVGGVAGHGALQFFHLHLAVNSQTLQSLGGEVSLQHGCFLIAIIQTKGNIPVGGGPRSPKVHQTQLVRVGSIALLF